MKELINNYLKKLGVKSTDDLSEEDVFKFFKQGSLSMAYYARNAEYAMSINKLTRKDVIKAMRKSMKTNTEFKCIFMLDESATFEGVKYLTETGWQVYPK